MGYGAAILLSIAAASAMSVAARSFLPLTILRSMFGEFAGPVA
jgi:hypothetical protein